jgi:hypothetical protein
MLYMNVSAVVHETYGQQDQTADDKWVPGVLIVNFAPQIETDTTFLINSIFVGGSLEPELCY